MSTLNERQNERTAVDKLAAQNQIYADAKTRLGIYLVLSIPVIMLLNLVVKPMLLHDWIGLGKTFDLTDSIALYALLLAAYELIFLKNSISKKKLMAAKIQEDFDCTVYQLEWNQTLCGDKVCDSEVQKYSNKYTNKGKDRNKLSNWYTPNIEQIDSPIKEMLLCQKENLGWDVAQRKSFVKLIQILVIFSIATSLIASFFYEVSLKSLILSVIIPCWPAISFAIQNIFDNKTTIADKENLKSATNVVEGRKPTTKQIRNIQNMVFLNRANNSLIFDWFYTYLREANQQSISYASKQLLKRLI